MLSVIICTYNRDRYIYNVLRSLAENSLPRTEYEIVLVDNNCTDRTREECARFQADYPQVAFRYVTERQQGLSHARNRGIGEARGEVLVYVDDDATVNREYLRTYGDFFHHHPQAWAAGGPILPVYETAEPAWFSHYTKALITGYLYEGDTPHPFRHGKYPGGGNAAYRREVFDRTGPFNPALGRKGNSLAGAEEKEIFDTSYDVTFINGDAVEFDKNGEWTDLKCKHNGVPAKAIPAQIAKFVKENYAEAKILTLERDRYSYEVKLSNFWEIKFDKQFNVIDMDMDD